MKCPEKRYYAWLRNELLVEFTECYFTVYKSSRGYWTLRIKNQNCIIWIKLTFRCGIDPDTIANLLCAPVSPHIRFLHQFYKYFLHSFAKVKVKYFGIFFFLFRETSHLSNHGNITFAQMNFLNPPSCSQLLS